MSEREKVEKITSWLKNKLVNSGCEGFVVGVSGGIDSAVTSTLCALTNIPLLVLNMPIYQDPKQVHRSDEHIGWLKDKFNNIESYKLDLTKTFEVFKETISLDAHEGNSLANSRSRIRMVTLYAYANAKNYLVVGTGNKVEDYGVGFFTKYGDGGVDVSPIADLLKSEVYELAKHLDVVKSIQSAPPTDGLWGDDRTDEEQIGATYEELEWALRFHDSRLSEDDLTQRQKKVLDIYRDRHFKNKHKLETPPVCIITNF